MFLDVNDQGEFIMKDIQEGEVYIKEFINHIEKEIKKLGHSIEAKMCVKDIHQNYEINFQIDNKPNINLTVDVDDLEAWAKDNEIPGKNLLNDKIQKLKKQL